MLLVFPHDRSRGCTLWRIGSDRLGRVGPRNFGDTARDQDHAGIERYRSSR